MSDRDDFPFVALYYRKFYLALIGHSTTVVGAYWLACLAYLCDDCNGLKDDEATLKTLCHASPEDWEAIRLAVFNEDGSSFFKLEDGRWHQKRAREEFGIAKAQVSKIREQRSGAGKQSGIARRAKQHSLPPPPPPNRSKRPLNDRSATVERLYERPMNGE